MGSSVTVPKQKSVQGGQSEMSTHRDSSKITRVKFEKVVVSTVLKSKFLSSMEGDNQHMVRKNSGKILSVDARKVNCSNKH